ncbi:alanine racemase [Amycolatopsis rhizosphaerae]|uniref:alanine racemase n=1 Tax=Amycolatopsis rhizosphaerae TaxID=2053003 RepID=UPI001C940F3E|nr:alanine racemase [Amycolatopsis rhizosphaerae]
MTGTVENIGVPTVAPEGTPVTGAVVAAARRAALPAYVYDLGHLDRHLAAIKTAFGAASIGTPVELLYAVKANPDSGMLATIAGHVHGLEVASGGELAHVRAQLPGVPVAFGGPAKSDAELCAALSAGVERYHVESLHELRRLDALARRAGRVAEVLLRVNIPAAVPGDAALTMGGLPSPFGMDPAEAEAAARELDHLTGVRVLGVHAHLASGLDATAAAVVAETVLAWAAGFARRHGLRLREVNVGGGMGVDYRRPGPLFDWPAYARRLARAATGLPCRVRIEPGRSLTAYSGWYATRVLELKLSHGARFAICDGGTHHLRTPAAKGHDQPLAALPGPEWTTGPAEPGPRQDAPDEPITFVGRLCTPKDVLARDVRLPRLAAGDLVLFAMAGAYAYNISHHDFLMHPEPAVVHVTGRESP